MTRDLIKRPLNKRPVGMQYRKRAKGKHKKTTRRWPYLPYIIQNWMM